MGNDSTARDEREARLRALVEFSQRLAMADFTPQLAAAAARIGVSPDQAFVDTGRWQYLRPAEHRDTKKVKGILEWRTSRAGVRYPVATFYSYRRGGISAAYDGYPDVVALFDGQHRPVLHKAPVTLSGRTQAPVDYAANRRRLDALWAMTLPLDDPRAQIARDYLHHRGLGGLIDSKDLPACLRYHAALPYWRQAEGEGARRFEIVGRFPALVAEVLSPDGKRAALHRTWLSPDGAGKADLDPPRKLSATTAPEALSGAAVRLCNAGERLAVAEGIETALAVRAGTGLPVWSTISAGGMARVEMPEGVREVLIFADHDHHGAGERAARRLAARLHRCGITARLALPDTVGCDWNDVLNRESNHV